MFWPRAYGKTMARLQVPHLPVQLLLIDVGGLAVCWSVCLVGTGLDRPTGTRGL